MRLTVLALIATIGLGGAVQAAESPDIARQLAADAQGVVGSGDRLSLRLTQDGTARTLNPGEVYRDGWVLQALSSTEASLAKDAIVVRVGLNPSGAIAQPAQQGPAPSVVMIGIPDEATIARLLQSMSARLPQVDPARFSQRPGLTPEEARRSNAYSEMIVQWRQRLGGPPPTPLPVEEILGAAAAKDYQALTDKERASFLTPPSAP